jgi:hypothetical protein
MAVCNLRSLHRTGLSSAMIAMFSCAIAVSFVYHYPLLVMAMYINHIHQDIMYIWKEAI